MISNGVNPAIFKPYDILGRFPKELNAEAAKRIGNAVAVFLSRKYEKRAVTLLIGSDLRTSTPLLKKALIEGIITQGSTAVDVGDATSPLFYFLLGQIKNDGGVMVTASHNPAAYNGFKIRDRNEFISGESGLKTIQKIANEKKMACAKTLGGVRHYQEGIRRYADYVSKRIKIGKVRVLVDAAGGAATLVLPEILSRFPSVLYKPIFFHPDGAFSVHDPNPLNKDAQEFLKEELRSGTFDFGVIFDGDADRIIFFDEFGNEVRSDFIGTLLAEEFLKKYQNGWIVLDLTASRAVEEYIHGCNGKTVRSKIGSANMQAAMRKKRAILGCELSGHFFLRDFNYNESSEYVLLKMLEILSATPRKLSHLVAPLQKYISGLQVNFKAKNKQTVIRQTSRMYKKKGGVISRLDGITVSFHDWWFNLRPSNTEPLVRLTLEARTQELFDEKQKELTDFIRSIK